MLSRRRLMQWLGLSVVGATAASAQASADDRWAGWLTVDQMKVCNWRDGMYVDWTQTITRGAGDGTTWIYYRCQRDPTKPTVYNK